MCPRQAICALAGPTVCLKLWFWHKNGLSNPFLSISSLEIGLRTVRTPCGHRPNFPNLRRSLRGHFHVQNHVLGLLNCQRNALKRSKGLRWLFWCLKCLLGPAPRQLALGLWREACQIVRRLTLFHMQLTSIWFLVLKHHIWDILCFGRPWISQDRAVELLYINTIDTQSLLKTTQ